MCYNMDMIFVYMLEVFLVCVCGGGIMNIKLTMKLACGR